MSDGVTVTAFQVALTAGGTAQLVEPESATPGAQAAVFSGAAIKAPKGNTTTVYLGPSGVTSGNGFPLEPGEAVGLDILGLGKVWFVGATTGDKLAVIAVGP